MNKLRYIIPLVCLVFLNEWAKAQTDHEYVDLGLSVEWATCNIGATSPEEYGNYYAWGEVEPLKAVTGTVRDYAFYENEWKDWVIYKFIGNDISGTRYDAASANWGHEWRMPTREEIEELMNNCQMTYTQQNGVKGHLFTGPSGKSIEEEPVGDGDYGVLVYKLNGEIIDVPGDNLKEISTYEDDLNGHEVVDLGLSIGWAACNIGAAFPEQAGTYFAWGETSPKNSYRMENYKFGIPPTQYNNADGKKTLEPEDDAAHVNWGGKWRMPTREEEEELYENCTWTWTTRNGVNGFRVTGPNGNSIFLPTTGLYDGDSTDDIKRKDTGGWYWSATSNGERYACGICFPEPDYLYKNVPNHEREDGHVIRPVLAGANTTEIGIVVDRISGDDVKIPLEEIKCILTYENPSYPDPNNPGDGEDHESVDLGLSVKWATCNVGAEQPEEFGGYYAWGELEEKEHYSMASYTGPGASVLYDIEGTEYDVAHVKWKGDWRMPTQAEVTELYQKCSHEWTTRNGVRGMEFTASNGNSIFIPAAGSKRYDEGVGGGNVSISLWSSSYAGYDTAFGILFHYSTINWYRYSRGWGFQVRPVKP